MPGKTGAEGVLRGWAVRKVQGLVVGRFVADWIRRSGGRVRGPGGRVSGPANPIRQVRNDVLNASTWDLLGWGKAGETEQLMAYLDSL